MTAPLSRITLVRVMVTSIVSVFRPGEVVDLLRVTEGSSDNKVERRLVAASVPASITLPELSKDYTYKAA